MARRTTTAVRRAGRPTRESAEVLRERLLTAALDEFLARGYEGASLNSIAQAASVSRDTIYRQFSGKPALFLAATNFAFRAMAEHLESVIDLEAEPQVVLRGVARFIHDDTRDPYRKRVIRLVMQEANRVPEIAQDVIAQSHRFVEPLASYLEHHRSLGHLQFDDAHETALNIAVLVSGGGRFFVDQPAGGEKEDESWLDGMLQLLLHGLARRAASGRKPAAVSRRQVL